MIKMWDIIRGVGRHYATRLINIARLFGRLQMLQIRENDSDDILGQWRQAKTGQAFVQALKCRL